MNGQRHKEQELLSKEDIQNWIKNGADLEKMKRLRGNTHRQLAQKISVGKIRKFYQEVVKFSALLDMGADTSVLYRKVLRIYMLLAYEKGRQQLPSSLVKFLEEAVNNLEQNAPKENYWNFKMLMEALVAFHREKAKKN